MKTPVKLQFPVQKFLLPILVIVLFIAVISSVYLYSKYQKTKSLLNNPQQATKEQIDDLVKKVGVLIELPNEKPTVATVTNKNALKNQAFFANAENGDKVLIFTEAKKAILYRPSINKIIEVGPVNIGPTQATATSSAKTNPTTTPTISITTKVAIYNGTKVTGLAASTETQLTSKISSVSVVLKSNAEADYTKTLVIDLTGKNKNTATEISKILSGEVGSLPSGESKPDADILIILGK
jgi:hypothetical protein